ncbi:Aminoglycoside N(6')-acetyltransferase type 1 [Pelotomaculum schinkii]|uniref:Aminoglycoside N(6')-acetyltransferase type 1 n=1 Tax=Pelotomaculum schinkii TaxID=78350 RepID=A0A4Y7REL8_9FIRM|nr:Aminoglycoside N(6')-acetyltransferase type 1 [Pelotomaculum schinkii]
MKLVFTSMRLEHLNQVLDIEEVSYPAPWSYYAFAYELLQNNLAHYIVALSGHKVVGYSGMWLILDEAHITNVAVHPDYRQRNIGKSLMLEMIRLAVEKGSTGMTLEVRPTNTAARRLYEALGFVEKGRRKKYYTDNNEDAIIMWKSNLSGKGECSTGQ